MSFALQELTPEAVEGKEVLEVGARDINGSLQPVLQSYNPQSYTSADLRDGPNIDDVVDVCELAEFYGSDSFDIVIATELLEHVRDWQGAITNLKAVTRSNGLLLVTTRSRGFEYHGYPEDHWRFELSDFEILFSDMDILRLENDPVHTGVFMIAEMPEEYEEVNIHNYEIYNIILGERNTDTVENVTLMDKVKIRIRKHGITWLIEQALLLPHTMATRLSRKIRRFTK